jgi:large subunit ribosomal protein L10
MADKPVRTDKATAVADMTEQFRSSTATVLTEYRGLTVAQLKALRRALGETTRYAVTKNTLAKRAAADAGITGLDDLFTGPTALAFVSGDVVEAAKGLRDFARANPFLVIKGGVFEGRPLSANEVSKLADLESREVLLAKLAGAMKANLSKAAATFQAPLTQAVRLMAALQDKRGGAADSTAADSTAADSTAADSTAADSTAADSTAADSTAADSTAADSTAAPAASDSPAA